jgi:hypothetical protein
MGIPKDSCMLLMKEHLRRPLSGSLLTLGVQDILFSKKSLYQMAEQCNFPLKKSRYIKISTKPDLVAMEYLDDRELFKTLGFNEVLRLDYSDYEGADITFDLNSDSLPEELCNRFDMIIDGGTTEHVFHVPNLLRSVSRMLKVNGRIVHLSPSSNYMDHGFYMFSPTLFYDYYSANKFEVNTIQLMRHSRQRTQEPSWILEYTPDGFEKIVPERFANNGDSYLIACIATKTEDSTEGVVPQQGHYCNKMWRGNASVSPEIFQKKFNEIINLARNNEVDLTLAKFPELLEMSPQDGSIHFMYAKLLMSKQRHEEALIALENANISVNDPEIIFEMAKTLFVLKRNEEALQCLNEICGLSTQWAIRCNELRMMK